MRDYSQPGDPYRISEYTAQSADQDVESVGRQKSPSTDARGNSVCAPRALPTQAEADAIKAAA